MTAKKRFRMACNIVGCAILLLVTLFPIYWLVAMAIRPTEEMTGHISVLPKSFTLEHFVRLFTEEGFGQAVWNSLQTTTLSLVLSLAIGLCAAYVLSLIHIWTEREAQQQYDIDFSYVTPPRTACLLYTSRCV